jgi:hypothetical protein
VTSQRSSRRRDVAGSATGEHAQGVDRGAVRVPGDDGVRADGQVDHPGRREAAGTSAVASTVNQRGTRVTPVATAASTFAY